MAPEENNANLDAVRKQLEYYFSDSNLPRDRFLLAKTEENPQGFVPLSTLLTFNRLKKLGAVTVETLAAATQSSTALVLDESKTSVRRSTPLPEESLFPTRAVHLKGWVPGGPEPDLDYLHKLFSPSGTVLAIKIRRWNDDDGKHFKGSIFVEMDSPEAAERLAAEDYEIEIEVDGQKETKALLAESYYDWVERKRKERDERKAKARAHSGNRKLKSKNDAAEKATEEGAIQDELLAKSEPNPAGTDEAGSTVKAEVKRESEAADGMVKHEVIIEKKPERTFTPGLVLRYEGIGENATREDVRDAMEEFGTIAFVDFFSGQTEGNVRFSTPDETKRALAGMTESGKLLAGKKPTLRILDSEDEKEYWQVAWIKMESSRKRRRDDRGHGSHGKGHKRFRGGGRSYGRGNRGNRGRGNRDDRASVKQE